MNRREVCAGGLAGVAMSLTAGSTRAAAPGPIVATTYGKIRGYRESGLSVFKGVRYGADTGGRARFLPPQAPQPWEGVVDTVKYGGAAVQGILASLTRPRLAEVYGAIFPASDDQKTASEDCLFLNVWTPEATPAKKRPVMFWLHGGGFAVGSGSSTMYDGSRLAKQGDAVIITVNHRLGALGHLQVVEQLGPEYASSANAGLLDIIAALKWVRDNISQFGGDPDNVTIFGESGGGMKVSILMAMPAARGLFHRAIIQSGPMVKVVEKDQSRHLANDLFNQLKIDPNNAQAIFDVPASALMAAAFAIDQRAGDMVGNVMRGAPPVTIGPAIDDITLLAHPFDPAAPLQSASIPLMIGNTRNEAQLFLSVEEKFGKWSLSEVRRQLERIFGSNAAAAIELYLQFYPDASPTEVYADILTQAGFFSVNATLAERKAAQGSPVFVYRLDWETPALRGTLRSPHTVDVPLVFDNVAAVPGLVGTGRRPQNMADQMSASWLAFARTGNPANAEIPKWLPYSSGARNVMLFNDTSQLSPDPDGEIRAFWQQRAAETQTSSP